MKPVVVVLLVCSTLSCGSFGVLLLQDRQLGVPLPYSVPLAFASMLVVAPAFLAAFERLRARRPIRIETPPPKPPRVSHAEGAPAPAQRRPALEGVVLLDFSTARRRGERAA
jgi:hypothetical protein